MKLYIFIYFKFFCYMLLFFNAVQFQLSYFFPCCSPLPRPPIISPHPKVRAHGNYIIVELNLLFFPVTWEGNIFALSFRQELTHQSLWSKLYCVSYHGWNPSRTFLMQPTQAMQFKTQLFQSLLVRPIC